MNTLKKSLKSCPKGSSASVDGWRFEHLKLLLESDASAKLLLSLCNNFVNGSIPPTVATVLAGAKLVALKKNNTDVRPIAVGNCIRRLTAKCVCLQLKDKIAAHLSPYQFGVCTPGGVDLMAHFVQLCLSEERDWILLKTDAKNAFNSVSREAVLAEVALHFPELYHFVSQCYVPISNLWAQVAGQLQPVSSEEGVQQGDPLGPFLFSLALQPVLRKCNQVGSDCITLSYLDDVMILGPKEKAVSVYHGLKKDLANINLVLREEKCEAFSFNEIEDWPLDVPVCKDGVNVLGCPLGSDAFVTDFCSKAVSKAASFMERLQHLEDPQISILILRYCANPLIHHLFRSVPPDVITPAANDFDRHLAHSFESILGCSLSSSQESQLFLPFRQGGFGLSRSFDVASCAFLGSWASSLQLLPERDNIFRRFVPSLSPAAQNHSIVKHLKDALTQVNDDIDDDKIVCHTLEDLLDNCDKLQSNLHHLRQDLNFEVFLESLPTKRDRARVIACGGSFSSHWLQAVPCTHDLTLSAADFRNATFLRLGAPLPALENITNCIPECKAPVDESGYHVSICKYGGDIIQRHDQVLDTFHAMLRSVDLRCKKEILEQFPDKKRPDIAVYDYKDGKKLLLDVTITHPLAKNFVNTAATKPCYAAAEKEKAKDRKYKEIAESLGHLFRPLAFEVFGRWGEAAVSTLYEASRLAPSVVDCSQAAFRAEWKQKIAVKLQREHSNIIRKKIAAIAKSMDKSIFLRGFRGDD